MVVEQKYDYSNKKLDFGFSYKKTKINNSLQELINSTKENIIICDTEDFVIDEFLSKASSVLNSSKTVIGLISDKALVDLKKKGVRNGFFRSTKTKINVAIIIIDKMKYYISPDANIWLELQEKKAYEEIFNYINHLIWNDTLSEFCQGEYGKVCDSRLSVVKPVFSNSYFKPKEAFIGTEDINSQEVLLSTEKYVDRKAYLLVSKIPSSFVQKNVLYINLFEDNYYAVSKYDELIKGESFTDASYSNFINDEVWFNNKLITIKSSDIVIKNIELPLDKYKVFKPDFDAEANKYSGFTTNLTIKYDINSLKKNSTYQKHSNYKNYTELDNKISSNLEKLIKLAGDEKKLLKKLESISSARTIAEKVEKYNKYIKETKIGDETLMSKKQGFKEITYKEKDVVVPSKLLGELLTKDKKTYFAVASEEKMEDVLKWLEDNHLEAVLILE